MGVKWSSRCLISGSQVCINVRLVVLVTRLSLGTASKPGRDLPCPVTEKELPSLEPDPFLLCLREPVWQYFTAKLRTLYAVLREPQMCDCGILFSKSFTDIYSHAIQFTHSRYTIQRFLIHPQICTTITTTILHFITAKRNPVSYNYPTL